MLFRKIIIVYCKNHEEGINTLLQVQSFLILQYVLPGNCKDTLSLKILNTAPFRHCFLK